MLQKRINFSVGVKVGNSVKYLTVCNSACWWPPPPGKLISSPDTRILLGVGLGLVEVFDVDGDVERDGDDVAEHGEVEVIMLNTSSSSWRVRWSKRFLFENTFSSSFPKSSTSSSQYIKSSQLGSFTVSKLLFSEFRLPFKS